MVTAICKLIVWTLWDPPWPVTGIAFTYALSRKTCSRTGKKCWKQFIDIGGKYFEGDKPSEVVNFSLNALKRKLGLFLDRPCTCTPVQTFYVKYVWMINLLFQFSDTILEVSASHRSIQNI
jgi:hypothetical protein